MGQPNNVTVTTVQQTALSTRHLSLCTQQPVEAPGRNNIYACSSLASSKSCNSKAELWIVWRQVMMEGLTRIWRAPCALQERAQYQHSLYNNPGWSCTMHAYYTISTTSAHPQCWRNQRGTNDVLATSSRRVKPATCTLTLAGQRLLQFGKLCVPQLVICSDNTPSLQTTADFLPPPQALQQPCVVVHHTRKRLQPCANLAPVGTQVQPKCRLYTLAAVLTAACKACSLNCKKPNTLA
jgi:hypothetical protein